MLVCFGAAWPFSIWKSYLSQATSGKSLLFLLIVIAGYLAGILNKLFNRYDNVIWLYILNLAMVAADTALFLRNRRKEQTKAQLYL
jgi:hypothetical protein